MSVCYRLGVPLIAGLVCASGCGEVVRPPRATCARDAPDIAVEHAHPARNLIVFMGDGMGPEQLSTARYVHEAGLRIDELAGPARVITDSLTTVHADEPELAPTDSAAAATVIATGVCVENEMLSLTPEGERLQTVLEVYKQAGKASGLVTTSFFFDASPAAFAAHEPLRGDYTQIVDQMLGEAAPDVIMGNGAQLLADHAYDLPASAARFGYALVQDRAGLDAWDVEAQPRFLGVFATDFVPVASAGELYSMTPALERRDDSPDPTLAEMTTRALDRLSRSPEGFFLFAEDELLDEMGHRGPAEVEWVNRAYPYQAAALDDAVGVAIDWVLANSSFDETLIVVLADHETGGYHYDHAVGPSSGMFSAFTEGDEYPVGNHTRTPTVLYARGPGSDALAQIREHADTHRLLVGLPFH